MYTDSYIHTYMYMYIHTYIYTYMHTYIHTYIYTYIHTYIHTYIYFFHMISYLHSNSIIFQDGDKFYQYVYYVMFYVAWIVRIIYC